MNRFIALFATLFVLALSFGGCAQPDHPRNDDGGRIWSLTEVIEEGAENGAGVEEQDTCDDCCFPGVCTFFCCNQPGGGGGDSGGGSGGGSCATKCRSDSGACASNTVYCYTHCGGCRI